MSVHELEISENHPLALELDSLRASVARYQHEAHTISVKLQRHSLEASEAVERSHALERENARLHEEIHTLRTNPDLTPHPAALQVPELSLALRRLSDKLTYTEDILLSRTNELAQTHNDLNQALSDAAIAQELAKQAHARLEEGKARERDLERKTRAAEEERRLADRALQEYADLVRTLEGRQSKTVPAPGQPSTPPNATPAESLAEDRIGLQRLLGEFNVETERLSLEISRLQSENETLKATLESERATAVADHGRFAETTLELDRYKADDSTAAKMVSRYMKFSQSTTDSLQEAMEKLRQRHNAAITTLELRLDNTHKSLQSERRQAEKLRAALDELSEDISREAFGRRREISLRLAFLTREEGFAESLRRWIRRSREAFDRSFTLEGPAILEHLREVHDRVMNDAEGLLETLNGQPALDENSPGSIGRLLLAQDSVASLTKELQQETERRFEAQRRLAHLEFVAEALIDGAHHEPNISSTPSTRLGRSPVRLSSSAKADSRESLARSVTLVDIPTVDETIDVSLKPSEEDTHVLPDMTTASPVKPITVHEQKPTPPPKDTVLLEPLMLTQDRSQEPVLSLVDPPLDLPASLLDTIQEQPAVTNVPTTEVDTAQSEPPTLDTQVSIEPCAIHHPTAVRASAQDPNTATTILAESGPADCYQLNSPPQLPVNHISFPVVVDDPEPQVIEPQVIEPQVIEPQVIQSIESAFTGKESDVQPQPKSVSDLKDALLPQLSAAKSRYDTLQRAFRDCNLALKDLRKDLGLLPLNSEALVRTAVDRLDDFSEDARVELEIRLADEERIITGYRTLLSVPGAISDEVDEGEMLQEIRMFVDGTDSAVARNLSQFSRKLDDLQHDVASVKRYMHELASNEEFTPSTPTRQPQSWSSWTAGILGGSRPVSPAPTFGAVMTSPRARQASFSSVHKSAAGSRPVLGALFNSSPAERENPFAALDLRIPMPAHAAPPPSPSHGKFFTMGVPRARIVSAPIYSLGLARSSSFGLAATPLDSPRPTPKAESHGLGIESPLDSDIE